MLNIRQEFNTNSSSVKGRLRYLSGTEEKLDSSKQDRTAYFLRLQAQVHCEGHLRGLQPLMKALKFSFQ